MISEVHIGGGSTGEGCEEVEISGKREDSLKKARILLGTRLCNE